ncbi:MAG: DUF1428 domain-containing protein [Luteolibacter sp.]
MSNYIDGFVLPLPKDKLEKYTETAAKAAAIWKEYGALEYIEAVGDDMDIEDQVPFPKLAGAKDGETVVFAYVVYKSREHRDEVIGKVMSDPRIQEICDSENPVFDYKRMAYGGFRKIVEG